jgi:hypothetical protein
VFSFRLNILKQYINAINIFETELRISQTMSSTTRRSSAHHQRLSVPTTEKHCPRIWRQQLTRFWKSLITSPSRCMHSLGTATDKALTARTEQLRHFSHGLYRAADKVNLWTPYERNSRSKHVELQKDCRINTYRKFILLCICSPTRYTMFLWLSLFTRLYLLNSVSDLTGPSSGASFKLYERIGKW